MRVVMLVGRSTGGIGTHVVDLRNHLRALGDEVALVTDRLTAEQFGIADARLWWPAASAGASGSLRGMAALRRLARGADVVHAHGHQAGLVAALSLLGLPTRLVVSQHNAVLARRGLRGILGGRLTDLVQRFVARRADLVTGASTDLVREAQRHGARAAALAQVPSPRVPELLAQPPPTDEERRTLARKLLQANGIRPPTSAAGLVVTIARIAPQKDLDILNEAAGPDMGAVWVVVGGGDGPLRDILVARARVLGAPVHYIGSQPDPTPWLRAADVFVLTSRWEARALVVQEAMAAGVPVVATDTGGLRDLVQGVGTLVPVGDPQAVAGAVERYLREPAARHTASAAGRERAASWDDGMAAARRWRQWYAERSSMT